MRHTLGMILRVSGRVQKCRGLAFLQALEMETETNSPYCLQVLNPLSDQVDVTFIPELVSAEVGIF